MYPDVVVRIKKLYMQKVSSKSDMTRDFMDDYGFGFG